MEGGKDLNQTLQGHEKQWLGLPQIFAIADSQA